ncbi:hypothetical protein [Arthrobacter sp. RCC_34]|uniref:hypothetical protein n=1 Tax=Arthrobacter sp. RCC_34 TaxID=3239230 RepID=UPI0035254A68
MSQHQSDGIGEATDDLLRQVMMVAARLAEVAARARQEQLTRARAVSERQGRELQARFEAERGAARASLAPVGTDSWWKSADADQIGAAYKTAASWSGQDQDAAAARERIEQELAKRGIEVTSSMPDRLDDLLRAREWAAEHEPFMDGAWTREMAQARTPEEKDRLNVALVGAWLASPEGQQAKATQGSSQEQDQHKTDLAQAEAWAKATNPERYSQWSMSHQMADTIDGRRSDERQLIRQWKEATGQAETPEAVAASVESQDLNAAAGREEDAAAGHRNVGDAAAARSQQWEDAPPEPDMDGGPSAEDVAWLNQQQDMEDQEAAQQWDTAERREEFASTLRGKADQSAVDARVLADVSQGTHPSAAVAAAPRNAPKARPNNARASRNSNLTKGSR